MIPTQTRDYAGDVYLPTLPSPKRPGTPKEPPVKIVVRPAPPAPMVPNVTVSTLERPPSTTVDQLGRTEIESLTGFAPDVPEILAFVDVGLLSGSATTSLASCFSLRVQSDALQTAQVETALQTIASSSNPTIKALVANRSIDGALDSARSVSQFIVGIETQFNALRRALDPRSSEPRLTTSYMTTNSALLQSSSAALQQTPVDALATNGYATRQAIGENCTATKAFMLLAEAAKRSSSVSPTLPRKLVSDGDPPAAFQPIGGQHVTLIALRNMTLDAALAAPANGVAQVIENVNYALRTLDSTTQAEQAMSQLLIAFCREYRLSAAVRYGSFSKLLTLLNVAAPTGPYVSLLDPVYGVLPFDVLSAQITGSAMATCYSSVNERNVLTYDDDYVGNYLPGQRYFFESLLGNSVDVFALDGIVGLSLLTSRAASSLQEWIRISAPPPPLSTAQTVFLIDEIARPLETFKLAISQFTSGTADPFQLLMRAAATNATLASALFCYVMSRLVRYVNDGQTRVGVFDVGQVTPLSSAALSAVIASVFTQSTATPPQTFDTLLSPNDVRLALTQKAGSFSRFMSLIASIMDSVRIVQSGEMTLFSGVTDSSMLLLLYRIMTYAANSTVLSSIVAATPTALYVISNRPTRITLVPTQVADVENVSTVMNVALHATLSLVAANASAISDALRLQPAQQQLQLLRAAAGDSAKYIMQPEQLAQIEATLADSISSAKSSDKFVIDPSILTDNTTKLVVDACANASGSYVVVGLPYGFLSTFGRKISGSSTFKGHPNVDIINVSVHKRDILRPLVAFRPITYTFDVSRFIVRDQTKHLGFGSVPTLSAVPTRRIGRGSTDVEYVASARAGGKIALSDSDYDWLDATTKIAICNNHVMSYFAEMLMSVAFDIDCDETSWWLLDPPDTFDVGLVNIMYQSYVTSVLVLPPQRAGKPIVAPQTGLSQQPQQLPQRIAVPSDKQIIAATDAYIVTIAAGQITSTFTNPLILSRRILSARKFDRTFIVPIDPLAFKVDEQASRISGASDTDIAEAASGAADALDGISVTVETFQ